MFIFCNIPHSSNIPDTLWMLFVFVLLLYCFSCSKIIIQFLKKQKVVRCTVPVPGLGSLCSIIYLEWNCIYWNICFYKSGTEELLNKSTVLQWYTNFLPCAMKQIALMHIFVKGKAAEREMMTQSVKTSNYSHYRGFRLDKIPLAACPYDLCQLFCHCVHIVYSLKA